MAALIYIIVAAFVALFLGVPGLFIALSLDNDRAPGARRVPVPSTPSFARRSEFSSERAAA